MECGGGCTLLSRLEEKYLDDEEDETIDPSIYFHGFVSSPSRLLGNRYANIGAASFSFLLARLGKQQQACDCVRKQSAAAPYDLSASRCW